MSKKRRSQDQVTRERKRKTYEVKQQEIAQATRAKYGPLRRAAPVTVKTLDGDVVDVLDPKRFKSREASPQLEARARAAGFAGYTAYLTSAYWAGVRAKVMERDGYRCVLCGFKRQLQVHHDRYEFIGDERLEFLKTICGRCHRKVHR